MVGRRDEWADYLNPLPGRVVGRSFGQKGDFGPQRPNRVLGLLHNPEGYPLL